MRTPRPNPHLRDVVDQMYTRVAQEWLDKQPRLSAVQRDFLQQARDFYEVMAQEESHDPSVRFAAAQAYQNAGIIDEKLGSYADAQASHRQATELLEQLVHEYPDRYDYQRDLANAQLKLGTSLSETQLFASAETALRRALEVSTALAEEFPDNIAFQMSRVWCQHNVGVWQFETGDLQGGLKTVRESIELWRNFSEVLQIKGHIDFASSLNNLGVMLVEGEHYEEALDVLREAIAHGERVLEQEPSDFFRRSNLSNHWMNLGNCYDHLRQLDEAIAAYKQVVELRKSLVRDLPAEPRTFRG